MWDTLLKTRAKEARILSCDIGFVPQYSIPFRVM
jgi:hypothetical protein